MLGFVEIQPDMTVILLQLKASTKKPAIKSLLSQVFLTLKQSNVEGLSFTVCQFLSNTKFSHVKH